jgi:hypothetical protein
MYCYLPGTKEFIWRIEGLDIDTFIVQRFCSNCEWNIHITKFFVQNAHKCLIPNKYLFLCTISLPQKAHVTDFKILYYTKIAVLESYIKKHYIADRLNICVLPC